MCPFVRSGVFFTTLGRPWKRVWVPIRVWGWGGEGRCSHLGGWAVVVVLPDYGLPSLRSSSWGTRDGQDHPFLPYNSHYSVLYVESLILRPVYGYPTVYRDGSLFFRRVGPKNDLSLRHDLPPNHGLLSTRVCSPSGLWTIRCDYRPLISFSGTIDPGRVGRVSP